jgi:hypothetical protein
LLLFKRSFFHVPCLAYVGQAPKKFLFIAWFHIDALYSN